MDLFQPETGHLACLVPLFPGTCTVLPAGSWAWILSALILCLTNQAPYLRSDSAKGSIFERFVARMGRGNGRGRSVILK